MDFQQTGKQDNAGKFERGYLKVTTEKSYQLEFARMRKDAEDLFLEVPYISLNLNSGITR